MADFEPDESAQPVPDTYIPTEPITEEQQPVNGNGAHVVERAVPTHQVQVTERYMKTVPSKISPDTALTMRGIRGQATMLRGAEREYYENLRQSVDSVDWKLRVYRTLPHVDKQGRPVPRGFLSEFEMSDYDAFQSELISAWGGGDYRVIISMANGQPVPGKKALNFNISQIDYPPKIEQYEQPMTLSNNTNPSEKEAPDLADERKRLKDEQERERLERQRDDAEMRKREAEIKRVLRMKELAALEREARGEGDEKKNAVVEALKLAMDKQAADAKDRNDALERRLEEQRKEAERNAQTFRESMVALATSIREVANKPLPVPPPDKSGELVVAITASQNQMMASLLPALMQKPPDNSQQQQQMWLEMAKLSSEASRNNSQADKEHFRAIVELMKPKEQPNALGLKDLLEAMKQGKSDVKETFELIRGLQQQDVPEAGADDAGTGSGFMAFLGPILQAAAGNPVIASLVQNILEKMSPKQQQWIQEQVQNDAQQLPFTGGIPQGMPPAVPALLPQPHQPQYPAHMAGPPPVQRNLPSMPPSIAAQQGPPRVAQAPAQGQPQPAPVQQAPQQPTQEQIEAVERLKDAVTESMKQCCDEIADKKLPEARHWPEHALMEWSGDFKQFLVGLPNNNERGNHIKALCDNDMFNRLLGLLEGNTQEQSLFWQGVNWMLEQHKARSAPITAKATVAAPIQPTPVHVPPVVTPAQAVAAQEMANA